MARQFNTKQPIVVTMADEAAKEGGKLSDYLFSEICQAFGIDEDKAMEEMAISKIPSFERIEDGWDVFGIDDIEDTE